MSFAEDIKAIQGSGDHHLMVCFCDKTCPGNIGKLELADMYPGLQVLLYVKNSDGDIVPVTEDMI